MSDFIERMSDRELVKFVAAKEGYAHSNKYYRDYIELKYNRHVSPSTTPKALGAWKNRNDRKLEYVKKRAGEYLVSSANDIHLAKLALEIVYDDTKYF